VHSDTTKLRLSSSEHPLDKALGLAVQVHSGHVDRAGRPYLLHVLEVVSRCREDLDASIVAALHDVVEDSSLTLRDLREQGFSSRVVEGVDALTRREGEAYEDSIERAAANPLARRVKLADLESNLDVRRLSQVAASDAGRLERYRKAWKRLSAG
jgi:(p)ppGpp synthase/HD superfamily hydrolase